MFLGYGQYGVWNALGKCLNFICISSSCTLDGSKELPKMCINSAARAGRLEESLAVFGFEGKSELEKREARAKIGSYGICIGN